MLWNVKRPGRSLADIAQGQYRTQYPTKQNPEMPEGGAEMPQTPRMGLRGPASDMMPGAWNVSGRGGRKPFWNDPSGKPYQPGPRPGIDYDTGGSAPTFDDWLDNFKRRFGR